MAIPVSAMEVLESSRRVHVLTMNLDGSPQMSCVWVGVKGGEIVIASLPRNR